MAIHLYNAAGLGITVLAAHVAGCGSAQDKRHAAKGTVEVAGAGRSTLAGHHVEAALVGDPSVRVSGEIGPDGKFRLEAVRAGEPIIGAPAGIYKARIVLNDDDAEAKRRAQSSVAARFFDFETSGLLLKVPGPDASLTVAAK